MLRASKRQSSSSALADTTPAPKKRKKTALVDLSQDQPDGAGGVALPSGAGLLDDSKIFRPSAHLAPSDVSFLCADKQHGFALHSFVLEVHTRERN